MNTRPPRTPEELARETAMLLLDIENVLPDATWQRGASPGQGARCYEGRSADERWSLTVIRFRYDTGRIGYDGVGVLHAKLTVIHLTPTVACAAFEAAEAATSSL